MNLINEIVQGLGPYAEIVFYHGLSEAEIRDVERKINVTFPDYYFDFLSKIGIQQDFIWALPSRIDEIENVDDILPEAYAGKFFRFADNGGEDYWLLRHDDPKDHTIYEYDHHCNFDVVSMSMSFEDLLRKGLEELKQGYPPRFPNSLKKWCVEFSIETNNLSALVNALHEVGCILKESPQLKEFHSSGVKSFEGKFEMMGIEIEINKSSFEGRSTDSFWFNWAEPIANIKGDSTIKKINNALKVSGLNYTMCDFGIMKID